MIVIESGKIDQLAQVFQLLSESNRLKILFTLEEEPRSVSEITRIAGLSQPLVSFHLKALREADLVEKYRESTFVFNRICDDELIKLIKQFSKYGVEKSKKEESSFPCPPWQDK